MLAVSIAGRVHRLPCDQHRNNGGLAGARRQFERKAHQLGVGLGVGAFQVVPELRAACAGLGRDLSQPYGGFDGFDLTEEGPDIVELVVSPVLEEPGRFGRHLPLIGIRKIAPGLNVSANLVDDRRGIVFLLLGRKPVAGIEDEFGLSARLAPPLRLRDRRD
jgi:hypothetical protein